MEPSKRHTQLQYMARRWIENRSFKICGLAECSVVGYLADFFAIAGMQNAHHERYAKYSGLKMMSMGSRMTDDGWETVIRGDVDRWYVCVFEVKVSRSDFLNTFGKKDSPHAKARMEPVGTAHWVVAEKGICKPEELPDFWGLLEPYGVGLTEKKMPKLNILPDKTLHAFGFDLLFMQTNFRKGYYDQMCDMRNILKELKVAIIRDQPTGKLFEKAQKAGMI